jgi:hypothetical protein
MLTADIGQSSNPSWVRRFLELKTPVGLRDEDAAIGRFQLRAPTVTTGGAFLSPIRDERRRMMAKKSARGRKQDRARVAAGQD